MTRFRRLAYIAPVILAVLLIGFVLSYVNQRQPSHVAPAPPTVADPTDPSSAWSLSSADGVTVSQPMADAEALESVQEDFELTIPAMYDIEGTVVNAAPETALEELFRQLEAAESEEEFEQVLRDVDRIAPPVSRAVVRLHGRSGEAETVTDSEGRFTFVAVPSDVYHISAGSALSDSDTKAQSIQAARKQIGLTTNREINLRLRPDLVSIKGRVTDAHGQPIDGATVTMVEVIDDPGSMLYPATHTTTSNADGSYEIQGLEPAGFYRVARYLVRGNPDALGLVEVNAGAPGYSQITGGSRRLPVVSETQLSLARRLLQAANQVSQKEDGQAYQEKENIPLPSIHGNTITGIDIVLDRNGG